MFAAAGLQMPIMLHSAPPGQGAPPCVQPTVQI
jgi:hypothetical protein